MEAFLNAVNLKLMDGDLPIDNSEFWNNYLMACKSPQAKINIKNSSHKTMGKFFQYLDK